MAKGGGLHKWGVGVSGSGHGNGEGQQTSLHPSDGRVRTGGRGGREKVDNRKKGQENERCSFSVAVVP